MEKDKGRLKMISIPTGSIPYIILETKKIARPIAVTMAELIQNRIVTCDSGHPNASK